MRIRGFKGKKSSAISAGGAVASLRKTADDLGKRTALVKLQENRKDALLKQRYPCKSDQFFKDVDFVCKSLSEAPGLSEALIHFSVRYARATYNERNRSSEPPRWTWSLSWKPDPKSRLTYMPELIFFESFQDFSFEDKRQFELLLQRCVNGAAVELERLSRISGK